MKILATALMVSATMLAGAAQADSLPDYPSDNNAQVEQQVTRAQVVAELHAAETAGLVTNDQDPSYPHVRAEQRFQAQHVASSAGQQAPGAAAVGQSGSHS